MVRAGIVCQRVHSQVADGSLNGSTCGEDTVVLEDEGTVLVTESLGNILAFLVGENYTTEILVECTLVVEGAAVLCGDFDCGVMRNRG